MPTETRSAPASAPTANTDVPVAPAVKQTSLDRWLSERGATEIGKTKAPARLQSTPGTLTCYAIDNREVWVYAWANGQMWKLLGDLGGIKRAERYLDGDGD